MGGWGTVGGRAGRNRAPTPAGRFIRSSRSAKPPKYGRSHHKKINTTIGQARVWTILAMKVSPSTRLHSRPGYFVMYMWLPPNRIDWGRSNGLSSRSRGRKLYRTKWLRRGEFRLKWLIISTVGQDEASREWRLFLSPHMRGNYSYPCC
jgi:hypothetical protein